MDSESEVARVRRVYQNYSRDPSVQVRWNSSNTGMRALFAERWDSVMRCLAANGLLPLTDSRVLEIGCGSGAGLAGFVNAGARPRDLHGVDVLPDEVRRAREQYPDIDWQCANAEALPFRNESFRLVVLFTVFSSILDSSVAGNVANEVVRVLQPGGAVLWYDFRFRNPRNPNVRSMPLRLIRRLFPDLEMRLHTISLVPPIARRLSWTTPILYPALAAVPLLRGHYLGLLVKPRIAR